MLVPTAGAALLTDLVSDRSADGVAGMVVSVRSVRVKLPVSPFSESQIVSCQVPADPCPLKLARLPSGAKVR